MTKRWTPRGGFLCFCEYSDIELTPTEAYDLIPINKEITEACKDVLGNWTFPEQTHKREKAVNTWLKNNP